MYFLTRSGYLNHLGVDSSEEFVDFIRENITAGAQCADALAFVKEVSETFTVIVMNDFIEHVPKDRLQPLVKGVRAICDVDGMVFVKTPNMTFPLAGWSRYMDFTHEIGFTEESIEFLLEVSGFGEVEVHPAGPSGINNLIRLAMWPVLRISMRNVRRVVTPNLFAIARP